MSPSRKLSGLQKEILALYRCVLREAAKKDRQELTTQSFSHLLQGSMSTTTTSYARSEFRKQAEMENRSDFKTIEYKLRKGHKQVNLLKMPGVNVVRGV
mmetsp:Transcript_1261/g.2259  ORF Transcript_1261/g.2259 Transcript_1261/m.2259 type:complete len:99 (-) Transcript_1261:444-740(-)